MKNIYVSFFLILLFSINAIAQTEEKDHGSCFEMAFSANYLFYNIIKSDWQKNNCNDSISSVKSTSKIGVGFGAYKNFQLGAGNFILRTGLDFQYHLANMTYALVSGTEKNKFNTASFSLPLTFIYSIKKSSYKPKRTFPYLVVGAKYSGVFNVSQSNSGSINKTMVYLLPNDLLAEIGAGAHLYNNKKHLFALELKYSYGFINVKESGHADVYNRTIDKLFRQALTLSLHLS
jgi:hypothetical protein